MRTKLQTNMLSSLDSVNPLKESTIKHITSAKTDFQSLNESTSHTTPKLIPKKKEVEEMEPTKNSSLLSVTPKEMLFLDYEPSKEYVSSFTLLNSGPSIAVLRIYQFRTKRFKVTSKSSLSTMKLIPGLSTQVQVVFVAPENNKTSSHEGSKEVNFEDKNRVYSDQLTLEINEREIYTLKVRAFPSLPTIVAPTTVDFGLVLFQEDQKQSQSHSQQLEKELSKTITFSNKCNKLAKCSVTLKPNSLFAVSPQYFSLGPVGKEKDGALSSSCELKLTLNPQKKKNGGKVEEELIVSMDNIEDCSKSDEVSRNYSKKRLMKVPMMAEIIKQTLQLCLLDTSADNNISDIDFGSIYYSQKKEFCCRLLNNSNRCIRWVVTHAGESIPAVPTKGKYSLLNESSEIEETRTAVSVYPSEGSLEPKSTTRLSFTFAPQLKNLSHGFIISSTERSSRTYNVPFQIRVITSPGSHNFKKDPPIDLLFKGKSCPFLAVLSRKEIGFSSVSVGRKFTETVHLINDSETLPYYFKTYPIAHFKVQPSQGTVLPKQKLEIQIVFKPNQMGEFQSKIIFDLFPDKSLDFLAKQEILLVNGTCFCLPSISGRISEVEPISQLAFQRDDKLKEHLPMHRTLSVNPFPLLKYTLQYSEKHDKLQSAFQEVLRNRKIFNDYVNNRKETRLKKLKYDLFGDDGVDVHPKELERITKPHLLDSETGLICTEPELIPDSDVISKAFSIIGKQKKHKELLSLNSNDDHQLRELFDKVKDSTDFRLPTSSEHSPGTIIDSPLSALDLVNIYTGFRTIDFGEVSVHSSNKWAMNFLNATPSGNPIHISITQDDEEDTELNIRPADIFVEPNDISGFEVELTSHRQGQITKKIVYAVNGRYKYQVQVEARVVLVDLKLLEERTELFIPITKSDDASAIFTKGVEGKLHISNSGNYPAKFKWTEPPVIDPSNPLRQKGRIELSQYEGIVNPKSAVELTVRFLPGINTVLDEVLEMQVLDPWYKENIFIKSLPYSVRAEVIPTRFGLVAPLKQGILDFGLLSAGEKPSSKDHINAEFLCWKEKAGTKTVRLKNQGSSHAAFTAELIGDAEIVFEPPYGILPIDSFVELNIAATPTKVGIIEDIIVFSVIGSGKVTKIPIRYEAKQPEVEILFSDCECMSNTIIHSWSSGSVDIKNIGDIMCEIVLDMTKYPEFMISLEEPNEYTMVFTDKSNENGSNLDLKLVEASSNMDSNLGKTYILDMDVGETVKLYIVYRPKQLQHHNFSLPLVVVGQGSSFNIPVKANCIETPIVLSRYEINFRNRIVYQDGGSFAANIAKNIGKESFEIRNKTKKRIMWWFDLSDLEQYDAFCLEPQDGVLQANEACEISATFQPESIGHCHCVVPLHVENLGPKAPFSLRILGTGVNPSLTFDPPEVFLPVGPVGFISTASVSILNYGCDRTEVTFVIPEELQKASLEFTFPEGRLLKSKGERLKVIIKFGSTRPFSFTAKIEMRDSHRGSFYLPVHGSIDNSIMTNCFYMEMHRLTHQFSVTSENGPVKFLPIQDVSVTESDNRTKLLVAPTPVASGTGINLLEAPFLKPLVNKLGETLKLWINFTLQGQFVTDFPESIIASNGKILFDFAQTISGKKSFPMASMSGQTGSSRVTVLFKQYTDFLTDLSSKGGFVASIKPEHLFSFEDYRTAKQLGLDRMQKADSMNSLHEEAIEYFKKFDKFYNSFVSFEAWSLLFLQVMKLYVFGAITWKHYKNLAGLQQLEEKAITLVQGSNIFSVGEGVILVWVSTHYFKETGVKKRFVNFDEDFKDFTIYAILLKSHLPHLKNDKLLHFDYLGRAETRDANIKALCSIFSELYGLEISLSRMQTFGFYDHLFLSTFLYQTLPTFIPQGTIEFKATLHQMLRQALEVSNPCGRQLSYIASIEGSKDFILKDPVLHVPPKGTAKLFIEFTSRFTHSSTATLFLKSKSVGFCVTSVIVFQLVSQIEDSPPQGTIEVESPIYHTPGLSFKIELRNPFPQKGLFRIQIISIKKVQPDGFIEPLSELNNPPPFRIMDDEISLLGFKTGVCDLVFLPFEMTRFECVLRLIDYDVGEFMFKVVGQGLFPSVMETVQWGCKNNTVIEKPLRISTANLLRDRAIYFLLQNAGKTQNKAKMKESGIINQAMISEYMQPYRVPLKFDVKYTSDFFSGPSDVVIKPIPEQSKDQKKIMSLNQNYIELPISFAPKHPGKYECKVILSCPEIGDIRVFQITGMVMSEGSKADLEFRSPARQSISQQIPIVNKTPEDWTIKASIQAPLFFGPFNVVCKANQTTMYPITFLPIRPCETEGVLLLSNLQTSQKYSYNLRGIGLDPLPEDNIIINCQVREKIKELLIVKNSLDIPNTFEVKTDIPFGTGEKSFTIPPESQYEYEFSLEFRRSGDFNWNIFFISSTDGSYIWFTIECHVEPPPPEESILLSTFVRKTLSLQLSLSNPTEKLCQYKVNIEGVGLKGLSVVDINPGESVNYVLLYSPMLSSVTSGKIEFINDDIGEFRYMLTLEAKVSPPIRLDPMVCELGKYQLQVLTIENPVDRTVVLEVKNTNPQEFQVIYPASTKFDTKLSSATIINVKPLEIFSFAIAFWPSSLTQKSFAKIVLSSQDVGDYEYEIEGEGTLPKLMDMKEVHAIMGEVATSFLTFTNPLIDPIPALVYIDQGSSPEFKLLVQKKGKFNIPPHERLEIPFTFSPTSMKSHNAMIVVEMSQTLMWRYPVKGITEAPSRPNQYIYLEAKSRESTVQEVTIPLSYYVPQLEIEGNIKDEFSVEIESEESIKKFLTVQSLQLSKRGDGAGITCEVIFSPKKPFSGLATLKIIQTSTQNIWKQLLKLVSLLPTPDDIITIEGAMGKMITANVIVIAKGSGSDRPFKAYLTSETPAEFSVKPSTGLLTFMSETGNCSGEVTVGYKPAFYGRTHTGNLIVEVEEETFIYELKGILPKYQNPASEPKKSGQRSGSGDGNRSGSAKSKRV